MLLGVFVFFNTSQTGASSIKSSQPPLTQPEATIPEFHNGQDIFIEACFILKVSSYLKYHKSSTQDNTQHMYSKRNIYG